MTVVPVPMSYRATRRGRGRAALDRCRDAGAELPVLVLPAGRPVAELEYALAALRPNP